LSILKGATHDMRPYVQIIIDDVGSRPNGVALSTLLSSVQNFMSWRRQQMCLKTDYPPNGQVSVLTLRFAR